MSSSEISSTIQDPNDQYDFANMTWVGVSAAGVLLMIPGIGLLYSGLSRRKHSLSSLWLSLMAWCVCLIQWWFWGYSLVFSDTTKGHGFLGTLKFFAFRHVLDEPSAVSTVPQILYAVFQGMFASVAGVLALGGANERARLFPMMVFLFIWMTLVYCPCACWSWNSTGWLEELGELDFAGSLIHETGGVSSLIYALLLGRRDPTRNSTGLPKYKPHSVINVVLGTIFIFFAWIFFNGGSAGNSTIRAWYAIENTVLAASFGGMTWLFIDYFKYDGKWTTVGISSGIISALVAITPGAGYVPIWSSMIFGIVGATCCNFAIDVRNLMKIDEGFEVWALHAVGGVTGSILTAFFAAKYVNNTAGVYASDIGGGWLDHHWVQLGYQLAGICAICSWAAVVTAIILLAMNQIPWLKIRLTPEEEEKGTDLAQLGEAAYYFEDIEGDFTFIPEPVKSHVQATNTNTQDDAQEEPDKIDITLSVSDGTSSPDENNRSSNEEK
ncbi:hypothetical protein KAFR_0A07350 [Kazachstania africana CBS 2517]|uniref:Ammonium transporter n=1 Tax=Kazachstania africana (strain ATCC 22294 / BCRC 22015 / CBS 2517 / CECT 1963 / NBRC 1671 / NRRL Y-8276) TaxID=1071382 RepID=H2AP69_KAZAF|nr:hypothetical protein KAFR_0A07350 [Kazachstania africana CBS 2517]CCF56169.1 hypothetical protein KAFR_0A07350 [Kazachstania africana CBS 2517]